MHFPKLSALVLIWPLCSGVALAGAYGPQPVLVDLRDNLASGDVQSARYTPGYETFIVCSLFYPDREPAADSKTFSDGSQAAPPAIAATCSAQDQYDNWVQCWTDDPVLAQPIHGITEASFIQFGFQTPSDPSLSGYECNFIEVILSSTYIPTMAGRTSDTTD